MNITDKFVFVHMPKTGGSFVSSVLRTIHNNGWFHEQLLRSEPLLALKNRLMAIFTDLPHLEFNKHGTCNEIPVAHQHKPILSCIRNPLDWYVSNYKYAWWRTNPDDYLGLRNEPGWPNLTFERYMELSDTTWLQNRNQTIVVNPTLGRYTVLFVNFYCRHPQELLALPPDTPDLLELIQEDMHSVHFLHTHNLNEELYAYLAGCGYSHEQLAFILHKGKISPRNNRGESDLWSNYYTPEMIASVRRRDRVLFALFPQFSGVGI